MLALLGCFGLTFYTNLYLISAVKGRISFCTRSMARVIILRCSFTCERTRDSVVSIVTGLRVGRFGVRSTAREVSVFSKRSRPALGPVQPSRQWVLRFFP